MEFQLNDTVYKGGAGCSDSTDTWRNYMAGTISSSEANYENSSGWVLDTRFGAWLEIEPRPDDSEVYDVVIAAAPDQRMIVFGGQTWTSGDGQLVNHAWLWTPPAKGPK